MKRKTYKTRRLVLRPYRKTDYKQWFLLRTQLDPKRTKYDRGPVSAKQATRKIFMSMLRRHEKSERQDKGYVYAVFVKRTGALIGVVDFYILFRENYEMANFGYWLGNRFWGQGYGREAARAGLRIGFSQLKLHRLEAAINLDNPRSRRLAEAIGMRPEGIKRGYIYEFNKWTDQLVFAATPECLRPR